MKAPHQAAIDQARLLADYLMDTPSSALDLHFIRHHLEALSDFAVAARTTSTARLWTETGSTEFSDPLRQQ